MRRLMLNSETEDEEVKEWKLIGEKEFSESDLKTSTFDFECDECTELFIEDDNLISNQNMGYSVWINDIAATANNNVRTTEGIRHRKILLMLAGDVWWVESTSYDYDTAQYNNCQVLAGKLNTNTKATKVTVKQSNLEEYQIFGGSIRIWGR